MSYQHVRSEIWEPGIVRITLDRPEKRNPLSPALMSELQAALEAARADAEVRVIVLTGAGKVFSAGGDLSQLGGAGLPVASGASGKPGRLVELFLLLTRMGKPVIAMVNGHAMAGGLGLMVACDLAVASEEAQFGCSEINVGLWPMMIMAEIFRCIGRKKGLELITTGDRIDAREAERIGLINRAVPAEQLGEQTLALARKLAGKSPVVLRLGLQAFYDTQDMDLEKALPYLETQLIAVLATEDSREGLTAFIEKRAPVWKGR